MTESACPHSEAYTNERIREILRLHALWLAGAHDGVCANLSGADLSGAYLSGADLSRANLSGADLSRAYLSRADLSGAYLSRADLSGADLSGADLSGTVLDPSLPANGVVDGFGRDGDYVIGYRTKRSPIMGGEGYEVGKEYTAPVFSVCPVTDCHPGLYLWPTLDRCENGRVVMVRAHWRDVHRTPTKWRCRKFTVIEEV